ncbi:MAG: hypothetical protein ACT4PT_12405 [Methanobacteriota archaeon]
MGETESAGTLQVYRIQSLTGLWALFTISIIYFLWIVLVVTEAIRVRPLDSVTDAQWVLSGIVVFLLVLLLEFLYLRKRGVGAAQRAAAGVEVVAESPVPTRVTKAGIHDEYVTTNDLYQGKRVLEYSKPPKSQHSEAVYAKTYVDVGGGLALRVEELVAEPSGQRF